MMRPMARAGLWVAVLGLWGCLPDLETECAADRDCPAAVPLCIGGICTRVDPAEQGVEGDALPDRAVEDAWMGDGDPPDRDGPDMGCVAGPEVCNGLDDDCDGMVDEGGDGSPLSRSCYTGDPVTQNVGACQPGRARCTGGAYGDCEGQVVPVPEACDAETGFDCALCNGEDDDCDGMADEGLIRPCGPQARIGVCRPGTQACGALGWEACEGAVEGSDDICDGLDNDCDLSIDEALGDTCVCTGDETRGCPDPDGVDGVGICRAGTQRCTGDGTFGECGGRVLPELESCNLIDDDCDGTPDEGTGGDACWVGMGACRTEGMLVCPPDSPGLRCDAVAGMPRNEACNTIDDDCDGRTDEGIVGTACQVGTGECRAQGVTVCEPGGARCEADPRNPAPEVCNGRDDDCDGRTDEREGGGGPLTRTCYPGPAGTRDVGICVAGSQTCNGGRYGECMGATVPAAERCNDTDDDCDALIDDLEGGATCVCSIGERRACYTGPPGTVGVGPCRAGEQSCVEGAGNGTDFGACAGEVRPGVEACNGIDDDCDGTVDGGADALCGDPFGAISVCAAGACDFNCLPTWADRNNMRGDGCERGCGPRPMHVGITGPAARVQPGIRLALRPDRAEWAVAWLDDNDALQLSVGGAQAIAVAEALAIEDVPGDDLALIGAVGGYTVMLLGDAGNGGFDGLLVDLAVDGAAVDVVHTAVFSAASRPILLRRPIANEADEQLVVWIANREDRGGDAVPFVLRRRFGADPAAAAAPPDAASGPWSGWPALTGATLDGEPVVIGRVGVAGRPELRAFFTGSGQQVGAVIDNDIARGAMVRLVAAARDDQDLIAVAARVDNRSALVSVRGGNNRAVLPWSTNEDTLLPTGVIYGAFGPILLAARSGPNDSVAVPVELGGGNAPLRVNGPHAITPEGVAGFQLLGVLVGNERRVVWLDANRQPRTAALPCQ
ncbi:MAG: hypothetical protein H6701_15400 [Myxococcales bacterium]|nr:hypothetical protein [Myxococcales bacterium]MCB9552585.1 hypothetical protein [Myxococcales bacterium]